MPESPPVCRIDRLAFQIDASAEKIVFSEIRLPFDGASEMTISSVVRDPADDSAILITMSATASGTVTVSYGNVAASGTNVQLSNVVKNDAGLPLPQFAALTVA